MQTSTVSLTDSAWSTVDLSYTGLFISGGSSAAVLVAIGTSEPSALTDAHHVKAADMKNGWSIGGLASNQNAYIRSVSGSQTIVATY